MLILALPIYRPRTGDGANIGQFPPQVRNWIVNKQFTTGKIEKSINSVEKSISILSKQMYNKKNLR
jgi:hypothetical protein